MQFKDTKRRFSQSYATFIVTDQGQDSEVYYNAIRMKMEKSGFHKVSPRSDHHEMYKAIKRGS